MTSPYAPKSEEYSSFRHPNSAENAVIASKQTRTLPKRHAEVARVLPHAADCRTRQAGEWQSAALWWHAMCRTGEKLENKGSHIHPRPGARAENRPPPPGCPTTWLPATLRQRHGEPRTPAKPAQPRARTPRPQEGRLGRARGYLYLQPLDARATDRPKNTHFALPPRSV